MQISQHLSLKPYNSFAIDVKAKYFAAFESVMVLEELLSAAGHEQMLVLGGGSNILFTGDFNGWVLKNECKGIRLIDEDDNYFYVKAAAGENWHQFVMHCIAQGYAGVENLSLIPGNVGASPMQNIGAYGVEIKDVFHELEAFHREERKLVTFTLADCSFGYRESVFKNKYKDQFIILNVTFRLRKKPVFNTSYGAIEQELEKMGVQERSIKAISEAVIHIRRSKLPDPAETGNAGSFFKNPIIPTLQFEQLQQSFPAIVGYPAGAGQTKVAAGWLIEQCGWKGYRKGDAGCHARQALVLVNYGNATGAEIVQLSTDIINSVQEEFGIHLEREVNLV
ncbi:UDP-N-acetylmuramate dehydrogenase [Hydrobacter penzbergensis]|uniref:UDP-N-acetylenolpyruvoylglucosamine reductase n=1 Tax=Hydrobacter penzbergensis TaxID=1235997 RepID=A0A8X8ICQ3_9BACT|nr:UDP-N-acetylmuramate dehydrogenase [Hydrobacter penzbergensis]SDW10380.1 UDP-N-acetylmuramate dehydrogenase [Hydrobacter penzbergensis]